MKKMLTLIILLSLCAIVFAEPKVVRIAIEDRQDIEILREMGASVLNDELEGVVDVIIEENNIRDLIENGFDIMEISPLSATGLTEIDPEYHTYEEFTQELQTLAATYPNLCKLDSIGHATQFPRTIWCMKVSDNPQSEEDELNILYIGIHHACEVMGGETLLYMIGHILENYGIDPVITFWIDNYQTYFVPLINPDGHYAVTQGIDNFWRKNARDTNNNGIYYEFQGGTWWTDVTEGIDLNRNYDWFWELGGSGDRRSYYYRGSAPFSENETQAIQSLGLAHHFVTGISFHSYGEVVIYPWSYYGQPAPDQDVYNTFASALASHFIKDSGGGYSTSIYSAQSGECRNWFYGVTGGMFFCIELMPFPLFTPPGYQLAERTQRYYNGAIYLYERIQGPGITGHVTDAVTGNPLEARVEIGGRISSQVYPRYSESLYGRYSRLLNPGSYTVIAGARNYQTQRIYNVVVSDTLTVLNIQLTPITVAGTGEEVSLVESPKISLNCSPNPFNNELTISYSLLEATQVSLKIFNSLGHMVYSEETGMQSMGEHSLKWNAQGQGSGIYFAQLTVDGDQSIAQKLLLLK